MMSKGMDHAHRATATSEFGDSGRHGGIIGGRERGNKNPGGLERGNGNPGGIEHCIERRGSR